MAIENEDVSRRTFIGISLTASLAGMTFSGCTRKGNTQESMLDDLGGVVDPTDISPRYVKRYLQPVNFREIIGDARVVLFSDNHGAESIHIALGRMIPQLKEAGITHFGHELLFRGMTVAANRSYEQILDFMKRTYKCPPSWNYPAKAKFIHGAVQAGFHVVGINPADENQGYEEIKAREIRMRGEKEGYYHLDNWSSMYQAESIKMILDSDPKARVAVLAGAAHTSYVHSNRKAHADPGETFYNTHIHGELITHGMSPSSIRNIGLSTDDTLLGIPCPYIERGKLQPHPYVQVKEGYLPLPVWAPMVKAGYMRSSMDGILITHGNAGTTAWEVPFRADF